MREIGCVRCICEIIQDTRVEGGMGDVLFLWMLLGWKKRNLFHRWVFVSVEFYHNIGHSRVQYRREKVLMCSGDNGEYYTRTCGKAAGHSNYAARSRRIDT